MKFTLDRGAPPQFPECYGLCVIETGIQLCAVQKLLGVCRGGCTVRSVYSAGRQSLQMGVGCGWGGNVIVGRGSDGHFIACGSAVEQVDRETFEGK